MIEYREYEHTYEKEVINIFTGAFRDYPLFYGAFENHFERKEDLDNCYEHVIKGIFKATIRQDECYVGLKGDKVVSVVITESPGDKPVGFWDYALSGMPGIFLRLGLGDTLSYMKLSEETEYAVKKIKEPRWHLYFLVVDPEHHSEGIGSDAIQNFLIPLVKKNNGKIITVTTNAERNVNFYIKNGFSLIQEETLVYDGKEIGTWTVRMDLLE